MTAWNIERNVEDYVMVATAKSEEMCIIYTFNNSLGEIIAIA